MLGLGFGFLSWLTEGTGGEAVAPLPVGRPRIPVACWINNTPCEWLGLTLQRAPQWMSGGAAGATSIERQPGLSGGRYVPLREASDLTITLQGRFRGLTLETRSTAANMFTNALRGMLEIRFPDAPTHVVRGVASPAVITPARDNAQFAEPDMLISVDIHCADTARYSQNARQIVLGTIPVPVPLGSLPSGGDIYVLGALTGSLDVELYSHTGMRTHVLALRSIDIPAGGFSRLRIDPPHAVLVYDATGEASSVADWRSLTLSSRWWKPTPFYADASRDLWPMMRLSAGTGVYRYHQAWEH